ncbi:LOW QUALITY PROTEIN: uncharacterized protein LOC141831580 [Curcuma longa]|uniref:LOW QUALITY PROTEIN: uncharacterized protein LOC141831580 n=1 Tax=Curcuma longa TaxID=136217 RepID=UPI003D9DD401
MKYHVENIILDWFCMPREMLLQFLHIHLHSYYCACGIRNIISFKFGISFSATTTEKALQSSTSSKGSTKLSAIITGTHS